MSNRIRCSMALASFIASSVAQVGLAHADQSYRTTILAVDGASAALITVGVAAIDCCQHKTLILVPVGFMLYALGPPGVHAANGNEATALGSLALRVALPVAAIAIAGNTWGGVLLGPPIAMLTAMLVEQLLFSPITADGVAPTTLELVSFAW